TFKRFAAADQNTVLGSLLVPEPLTPMRTATGSRYGDGSCECHHEAFASVPVGIWRARAGPTERSEGLVGTSVRLLAWAFSSPARGEVSISACVVRVEGARRTTA